MSDSFFIIGFWRLIVEIMKKDNSNVKFNTYLSRNAGLAWNF